MNLRRLVIITIISTFSFTLAFKAMAQVCLRYDRGMECIEWLNDDLSTTQGHCLQYDRAMQCVRWAGGSKFSIEEGTYCVKTKLGDSINLKVLKATSFSQEIELFFNEKNYQETYWHHTGSRAIVVGAYCKVQDLFAHGKYHIGVLELKLDGEELIFSKQNCKKLE